MKRADFESILTKNEPLLRTVREKAHRAHHLVNQRYDAILPYGYHLDMVADQVRAYGHELAETEGDVITMLFGAYFHDAIEDARLTYNDLHSLASKMLPPSCVLGAVEIAYALTNEKGRTRAERAGEKYYEGIRSTPFAAFVKAADRLANVKYCSANSERPNSARMKKVYASEMPHFIEAITTTSDSDPRKKIPEALKKALLDTISGQ